MPDSGFQNQKAVRKGNTETIRLRGGGRGTTRKWNAADNKWDFTKLRKKVLQAPAPQLGGASSSDH